MRSNKGFTLIEVMVVVAIIAILSAIAIPQYADYVTRSKVTDAISGLSEMRVRMEQYFNDNRSYVGACTAGTVAPLPAPTNNFTFACSNLAATTYTVTATGAGTMNGFSYSVTEANVRSTAMTSPSTWSSNASCWVLRKGGSC